MKRAILALAMLAAISAAAQTKGPELGRQYETYNARYFANRLPKDAVILYAPIGSVGEMGDTSPCGKQTCIRLDPAYNAAPRVASMTLLHEMCHVETTGTELDQHGAHWQACMQRLAQAGAFSDLW